MGIDVQQIDWDEVISEEIKINNTLNVSEYIKHLNDTNTYIRFTDDRMRFDVGGITVLGMHKKSSSPHQVTVNNGANNVDFVVKDNSNNKIITTDASTSRMGIMTGSPASELHINGALTLSEKSSDPSDPSEGQSVLWMSDGTGTGDDGDILIKITAGGVTKTATLVDFSAS